MRNIITLSDSYKVSHWKQYPPKTQKVYSYFESRGGEYPETVFFGLNYLIKEYLMKPVMWEYIIEAQALYQAHFGKDLFNREGWEHIAKLGYLPVRIKAVPEGTVVPNRNVLMTIENTDPKVPWLTNWLETLLVQVWYPCTVSTISRHNKKTLLAALEKSGDPSLIDFKLHDFGFRGSTSVESSALGGCAHLVNFKGTDTVSALLMARDYYNCPMAGFSIPASEHSTITAWGQENEVDAFRNMLTQFPDGLVACVSDSFDIYKACGELWGTQLRDQVLARDGTLVIRPDSGEAQEVLPEMFDIIGDKFGYTVNAKGYKVFNPKVRTIQGDGINPKSLPRILDCLMDAQWSADNIAFGSGGGLLQQCNRDTLKFAFKCSDITVDGEHRDVFKKPITAAWKDSKAGRMKLVKKGDYYLTVRPGAEGDDIMQTVFENGKLLVDPTLDEIRERAAVMEKEAMVA